jgi:hypothetical protein
LQVQVQCWRGRDVEMPTHEKAHMSQRAIGGVRPAKERRRRRRALTKPGARARGLAPP